jgi:hypothetical protein
LGDIVTISSFIGKTFLAPVALVGGLVVAGGLGVWGLFKGGEAIVDNIKTTPSANAASAGARHADTVMDVGGKATDYLSGAGSRILERGAKKLEGYVGQTTGGPSSSASGTMAPPTPQVQGIPSNAPAADPQASLKAALNSVNKDCNGRKSAYAAAGIEPKAADFADCTPN